MAYTWGTESKEPLDIETIPEKVERWISKDEEDDD
jgi:hypothetical protein